MKNPFEKIITKYGHNNMQLYRGVLKYSVVHNYWPRRCVGLCNQFSECLSEGRLIVAAAAKSWPHYSGEEGFPVDGLTEYFHIKGKGRNFYTGDSGARRIDLAKHIICLLDYWLPKC